MCVAAEEEFRREKGRKPDARELAKALGEAAPPRTHWRGASEARNLFLRLAPPARPQEELDFEYATALAAAVEANEDEEFAAALARSRSGAPEEAGDPDAAPSTG